MTDFLAPYWPWADLAWFPIAIAVTRKRQKIKAAVFILACVLALRLQRDVIYSTGHRNGFTNLLDSDVFYRGMCVYALFILVFLALSYYSPGSRGVIYMAAALSWFFMAFISSTVIMAI